MENLTLTERPATAGQIHNLNQLANNAVAKAIRRSRLSKVGAQNVHEHGELFTQAIHDATQEALERLSLFEKYFDQETESDCCYDINYTNPRSVEYQVDILRRHFPSLGLYDRTIANRRLPKHAEGWFAVPNWKSIDHRYWSALGKMLEIFSQNRNISLPLGFRADRDLEGYLRRHERTEKLLGKIMHQQKGFDIFILPAQFGMLHRGRTVCRSRHLMLGNEFGLGAFEVAAMLLTHPERMSDSRALCIDCPGDEYNFDGIESAKPNTHVTQFCFDDHTPFELEFSVDSIYSLRSDFGSATAFLP